jgi:hypothetical protein
MGLRFQLCSGGDAKRGQTLVTANKDYRTGEWRIGPKWYPSAHYAPRPFPGPDTPAAVAVQAAQV